MSQPDLARLAEEATRDAARAASAAGIVVRELHARAELAELLDVFDRVWSLGPSARPLSKDMLLALAHAGNPVLAAHDAARTGVGPGAMVAGSLGIVGVHRPGDVHVHSHMTGVLPDLQHRRIGRALKLAQRSWALQRGIELVTWTFDPLVARNGWFNLQVLGAVATEYLVDFYGPIDDAINGGDETDRLLVHWDLTSDRARQAAHEGQAAVLDETAGTVVEVPEDIVEIRRSDPDAAQRWRLDVRAAFEAPMTAGGVVAGMASRARFVVVPRR